jgi:hypothetical protein
MRVLLVAVSLSLVSPPSSGSRVNTNIWELAQASAPAQNNGIQKVAQPSSAAPVRTTPAQRTSAAAAAATPPTSNPAQKSSQDSPTDVHSSSKSKGNKKHHHHHHHHHHKGSKKDKGNKSKQQKSKKVGSPRNENTVVSKHDKPPDNLPSNALVSSTET